MLRRFSVRFLVGCILLMFVVPQITMAGGTQTIAGVTVTTPLTHASCVDAVTSDVVNVSGLNGRQIVGQFIVEYVVGTGRVLVQTYPINTTQDFSLTIYYPPVSQWPAVSNTNNTREIHVDVQLELMDGGSNVSIGAGLDWDVYCNELPPPPPPPPTQNGCTPGYWKNHQWWPTNTLVSNVFSNSTLYVPASDTLLKALAYKGGPGNLGAAYILLRASAAAWLNTTYLNNYPESSAQLQSEVNAALASKDRATILLLATKLDGYNNFGCPLN